ncbi:MAG: Rpn family recombination-promoting nuclease/putative transposase [Armatimonadaceae bacterium]
MSATPYDAVTKVLVETRPQDWIHWLGISGTEVTVVDADLSTVTTDGDRVLAVSSKQPSVVHLEFQAGHDPRLPERLLRYHVLLRERFAVPVLTVVFFLSKRAYRQRMNGELRLTGPTADSFVHFGYRVVRVWELATSELLAGELSLLPFAPIGDIGLSEVPRVLQTVSRRLREETNEPTARELLTATGILLGTRYSKAVVERLLKGVQEMRESSTYQLILERGREAGREEGLAEGRIAEAQRLLLTLGERRLGVPRDSVREAVSGIVSVERLESLLSRLFDVETWEELLQPSGNS